MTPAQPVWTRLCAIGLALAALSIPGFGQGGPPGALVNDLLALPGGPRWVYAATDAGVFRSRDDGATWRPYNEGLPPGVPVNALAGQPSLLFAALGGAGVWRSQNEGPWTRASDGIGDEQVVAVATRPDDPRTIFAGTASQGVFFSNNGGDGWIRPGGLIGSGPVADLAVSPANGQRVLVATPTGLVAESLDGGQNWTARLGIPGLPLRRIRFDPRRPDVAYVTAQGGVLRQPAPGQGFEPMPAFNNLNLQDFAADPNEANLLFATDFNFGLVRSLDGGATREIVGQGLPFAGGYSLLALTGTSPRLLVGAAGTGVFVSTDRGATVRLSSAGLNGADALSLAVDPTRAGRAFVSVAGGGMFRTLNGGDSWTESRAGLFQVRPSAIRIDPADPNRIYSGSINPFNEFDGALARSDDGGATWTSPTIGTAVRALALHPTDGNTVWLGSDAGQFGNLPSLYLSRDRGASFTQRVGDTNALLGRDVLDIVVDPTNPSNVYIISGTASFSEFLYSSNEGGRFQGSGQTQLQLFKIAIDPAEPRTIYLGSSGGVFRSTDSGRTFNRRNAGLPSEGNVAVFAFDFDRRDGVIYIATSAGVFRSTDGSASWASVAGGLEEFAVRAVVADPHTPGSLYALTAGAGVLRSADGGASWRGTGTDAALITRDSVVGAFDFQGGGVAPGELVSIFGQGIGPREGVPNQGFDPATGKLPTTLGGVRVFFDDVAAPLLFVRADQVNCQVPFEVAGRQRVLIRVEFDGVASPSVQLDVVDARPGLFPSPVLADGSVNGEANRSRAGDFVLLFATGQGLLNQPVETGAPAPGVEPLARTVAETRVSIDGREAAVSFSGLAPGFAGLLQVNTQVPGGLSPGRHDVQLRIGSRVSQVPGAIWIAGN